jgi:hypothetical protein
VRRDGGRRVATAALAAAGALGLMVSASRAQVGAPDPSLMAGLALPAPELPDGTVTVRVMREAVGNNAVGETVELTAGDETLTGVTDAEGRATFPDLPPDTIGTAIAVVDGEQLVSAPFTVPGSGGLRVILISGITADGAPVPDVPAVSGSVAFGPNSRVIAQFQEDALQVFYLMDLLNEERTPVDIGGPVLLELPRGAAGAAVMAASSSSASVNGDLLTVLGPFQPGITSVQVGFTLPHNTSTLTIDQTWPIAVDGLSVAVEQVGALSVTSPQFLSTEDILGNDGTPYFLAILPPLPAGGTVSFELAGLPVDSTLPRNIAVTMAVLILIGGTWLAQRGRVDDDELRSQLTRRRDTLLGDLTRLESRRRAGRESEQDGVRRQQLVAELEQIYGELDSTGVGPRGGGEDVAA